MKMNCPGCGKEAVVTRNRKTGTIRFDCTACKLWGYNGRPMVPRETHEARSRAHTVFDQLHKGHGAVLTRSKAYRLLAQELGMGSKQCHFAVMSKEEAELAIVAVRNIWKRLGLRGPE